MRGDFGGGPAGHEEATPCANPIRRTLASIENGNYYTDRDTRGCKVAASIPFSVTYTRKSYESRIDEVHILLREYDQINPPWGAWISADKNSFVVTRK